jgi:hypothetical protein
MCPTPNQGRHSGHQLDNVAGLTFVFAEELHLDGLRGV